MATSGKRGEIRGVGGLQHGKLRTTSVTHGTRRAGWSRCCRQLPLRHRRPGAALESGSPRPSQPVHPERVLCGGVGEDHVGVVQHVESIQG